MFPSPPPGLDQFPSFRGGDRCEYVALTVRQLKAGLLRLATTYRGGATVFPSVKQLENNGLFGTVLELASRLPVRLHLYTWLILLLLLA